MRAARALLWGGRIPAVLLAAGGLWLLGADLVRSAGTGALSLRPLGQVWYEADAGSLNLSQAVVERYLLPAIWDPGITTILNWPAFVLPLVLAALLALLSRPRRRPPQVS